MTSCVPLSFPKRMTKTRQPKMDALALLLSLMHAVC